MDAALKYSHTDSGPADLQMKRPAYDPAHLHPLDEEARKLDDTAEGIDWDEILATTEDDYLAGRHAFSSAGYPDHEAAMIGLNQWMDAILQGVLRREEAAISRIDAARR